LTPEEFGRLLVGVPPFYWDHFVTQVGTGLRSGELLGLQPARVRLDQARLEVVDVRYDAGRFGAGYRNRPKTRVSIRAVPLAPTVAKAVAAKLDGCPPDGRVFCGPGGSNRVRKGERSRLSTSNYRRVYRQAAELAALSGLDLHGPHDLRATYATLLEVGGIPARVIDELMGHRSGGRGQVDAARSERTTGTPRRRCSAGWSRWSRRTSGRPCRPCPRRAPCRSSKAGTREADTADQGPDLRWGSGGREKD
jgi:integrase